MLGTLGLRSDVYDYLLQNHGVTPRPDVLISSVGGTQSNRQGAVTKFELAGKTHENLLVTEGRATSSLGLNYLRRYMVTFDLCAARIYLAPGFDIDRPERDAKVGVTILRRDEDTVIEAVTEGSRAARAGFRLGDKLFAVDDVQVAGKPIAEINWILQQDLGSRKPNEVVGSRHGKTQILTVERE
jgi:hypothetical protein